MLVELVSDVDSPFSSVFCCSAQRAYYLIQSSKALEMSLSIAFPKVENMSPSAKLSPSWKLKHIWRQSSTTTHGCRESTSLLKISAFLETISSQAISYKEEIGVDEGYLVHCLTCIFNVVGPLVWNAFYVLGIHNLLREFEDSFRCGYTTNGVH